MPRARLGDVVIHYESHVSEDGPEAGDVLLLVMGLGTQQVYWPPRLIGAFTDAGFRVITYDNRDIGLSSRLRGAPPVPRWRLLLGTLGMPTPTPPYTLSDMAGDAVGLLDHLGVSRAHVLGVSMGGMIAQRIAIEHPERVATLTSVMSTTGARRVPPAKPAAVRALLSDVPVDDRDAHIDAVLALRGAISSPGFDADHDFIRDAVGMAFDRGPNPRGFMRHFHAIVADGDRTAELRHVDVPTLVVHGADDPLVNVRGGELTARAIPGARLKVIEGMGHDLPPDVCDQIAVEVVTLVHEAANVDAGVDAGVDADAGSRVG